MGKFENMKTKTQIQREVVKKSRNEIEKQKNALSESNTEKEKKQQR